MKCACDWKKKIHFTAVTQTYAHNSVTGELHISLADEVEAKL